MNSEDNARKAAAVLGHPVILQGAWMRVESWYRSGELAPQPELSRWRLHPEAMLRELAEALRDDLWKPEQWRQVPYPKKGARLRHYVMPTVRDQVAFMAHMVALGPILDVQVANFAFGNRWYRPIAWNRRAERPGWVHRPYPVLTNRIFLSYPRSHGLFRRVAHWTVARMTKATLPAEDESGRVQIPGDYGPETLPPWTDEAWWRETPDTSRAFWAALDIELAYPSVRINRLAVAMEQALRRPVDITAGEITDISMDELSRMVDFQRLFDGCPKPVSEALAVEDVRVEIGRRLTRALGEIALDSCGIPTNAWGPPRNHPLPRIVAEPYDGIPTGLAISGVLLNVALLEADRMIGAYLNQTSGEERGAIVRFADDMYVLSRSSGGLLSLIEAVHGALSGVGVSSLATPNEVSNICINFKKLKPDAAQKVIGKFLVEHGWEDCPKCGQPLPPHSQVHATAEVSDWWAANSSSDEFTSHRESLERAAIEKGDVGPFVTSLVELLSDMGTDTLRQRFGEGARDHLARLHELARFDIEDEQVRPDTRRAFSVNRLVRAWLPTAREAGEQHRGLRRIRETIGYVLDRTPWKFAIWRAVVRGAARRPLDDSEHEGSTDQAASEWLANQLRRIACVGDQRDSAAWLNAWPETDTDDGHEDERPDGWQELYLSFVRAAFWRALAQVLRELERHAARLRNEEADPWVPPPILWTTRAVAEGAHAQVAASLGRIDQWVDVLYPAATAEDIAAWPWELDEFVGAILAVHSTVELAEAWRSTTGPGSVLRVPATTRLREMPRAVELLSRFRRLQETGPRRGRKLDDWALANVQLGHWSDKLGGVLFPASDRTRISRAGKDTHGVLASGLALGCFEWIGAALASRAIPSVRADPEVLGRDAFLLHDYARARRVLVGQEAIPATSPTVHRLLWGTPEDAELSDWPMAAWETPAVGLPSRVAAGLLRVVRQKPPPNGWAPSQGPLTWVIDDVDGVLAAGRRGQFVPEFEPEPVEQPLFMERSTSWEVVPHAAFYRPFVSAPEIGVHVDSYVLYCDVLLLLTVLDGAERILDGLARWGVRGTPFVDRWAWRSRIHLPFEAWESIEKILRWSESPRSDVTGSGDRLVESLVGWSGEAVSWEDFLPERIDVGLSLSPDLEIVRTIRPASDLRGPDLPPELRVAENSMIDELVARVGQVAAWPTGTEVVRRFPAISSATANAMIGQVSAAFLAPAHGVGDAGPRLVVLPELAIPQQEVRSLRDLVRNEGKGAVAGLYWRALKPAFRPPRWFTPRWMCFVNEAELILPVGGSRGPPGIRWFRVRKPVPAHIEDGLAQALSNSAPRTKWRMLRGKRWYRFVHPEWGDFTVAICADLIDAAPWRALRGELLHLLMVAFNKNVDLFDSLTWVRAYEIYVNVASVNHGRYGGSFLWTPRETHGRELARLRGGELVLTADVRLPVKELLLEQRTGVAKAIGRSATGWQSTKSATTKFKAPPPGFRRKS